MPRVKQSLSVSVSPAFQSKLKDYTLQKGQHLSVYVTDLLDKAMRLPVEETPIVIGKRPDEEIVPVVLKVPKSLLKDPAALTAWMNKQTAAIVNGLQNV